MASDGILQSLTFGVAGEILVLPARPPDNFL